MWHKVIPEVCRKIEESGVLYHADASSSLYVCGFEFEMDDFDVTVEWGRIKDVWNLFYKYSPSQISGVNPMQFQFDLSGYKVDVMSYESETGIGPEDERELVHFAGQLVWTKKPSFYLNRMRKDHPIRESALHHFKIDK